MTVTKYAQSFLVCGAQESGKTFYTINTYINRTKRAVLVVMSDDLEPKFNSYKTVTIAQVNNLKPGTKNKIIWDMDDKQFWIKIRNYCRNYMIIFDDAGFFLTDSRAIEFQRIFMKNRQTNNHVFFICHGLGQVPPKLWDYFSYLIIFRTTGKVQNSEYKTPDWCKPLVEHVNEKAKKYQYSNLVYKIR